MSEEQRAVEAGGRDAEAIQTVQQAHQGLMREVGKVIIGQKQVVEQALIAIFTGGHCLLEGVPGLAKTLLVSSIAQSLHLSFKRIQFTPDLMPSDITGTDIIQEDPVSGARTFTFVRGPIFANVILADEINRTPPKTQAAMLEAMQEKQVSAGGEVHPLARPFFVMATQNPLEQEGTYPLPEAQQDRFLFKILVDYPAEDEEKAIVRMVTSECSEGVLPVLTGEDILAAQEAVRRIPVADSVIDYATRLVRSTRLSHEAAPDFVRKWVAWGCGPRASIFLVAAAKTAAAFRGADYVACDDIASVCHPVMRHRLAVNYTARADGINADQVIDRLLEAVPAYDA